MRYVIAPLLAAALAAAGSAQAEIVVSIDKSAQRMTVERDGMPLHDWPVSTGKSGYATPSGSFRAFRMEADHFSKEWDDAPMPHSIFFTKIGHAIHGSFETKKIGTPASHGCVRLAPANAATLYALVQREGVTNTRVVLTGSEQVALGRRPAPRNGGEVRETQWPRYPDSNRSYEPENGRRGNPYGYSRQDDRRQRYAYPEAEYRRQDYAQPRYGNPYPYNSDRYDARPQYVQPPYGYPYYRY